MAVSNSLFLQIANVKNVVSAGNVGQKIFIRFSSRSNGACLYSTASVNTNSDTTTNVDTGTGQKKMSKAMQSYLERARNYDAFIKKEREDYKIGKRHLANMMGEDPNHFTDRDVKKAIEYLFPSGLYDKLARPVMEEPEKIFPPKKAAEFNETGRPYHSLFYTTKPNYYKALYDMVEEFEQLKKFEDIMIRKGKAPVPENKLNMSTSDWVNQLQLEKILIEKMTTTEFEYFISSLQRLADHPYSQRAEEMIMKYRITRQAVTESLVIPEFEYDENGRPFIKVDPCYRKTAKGSVTIKGAGSGIIMINGRTLINYFSRPQDREQTNSQNFN